MRLGLIGFGNIATTLLDRLRRATRRRSSTSWCSCGPPAAAARARLAGELAGVASGVAVVEDAATWPSAPTSSSSAPATSPRGRTHRRCCAPASM